MFKLEYERVEHTPELAALLDKINKEVNNNSRYFSDTDNYGKIEYWTKEILETGKGDCEDYALAKFQRLKEEGLPWQCMALGTGWLGSKAPGNYHLNLLVRTSIGPLVLDNNTNRIQRFDKFNIGGEGMIYDQWYNPNNGKWYKFT